MRATRPPWSPKDASGLRGWDSVHTKIHHFIFRPDQGEFYALKLIEGVGISMSACREIAVSVDRTLLEFS